jgi:hypothetical protein
VGDRVKWLILLVFDVLMWLLSSWIFMVLVGVVHGEWLPNVPTLGYSSSLLISALISVWLAARMISKSLGEAVSEA